MRALVYNPAYTIDRDAQSLRLTMLARALASLGWRADIVTSSASFLGDDGLRQALGRIDSHVPSARVSVTHPGLIASTRHALHRTMTRSRGAIDLQFGSISRRALWVGLVPRAYDRVFTRIGDPDWIAVAMGRGLRLLARDRYALVLSSTSWYFASHVAAAGVSGIARLPLVLDYGDPWTRDSQETKGDALGGRLDRLVEAAVLRRADKVVVTNEVFRSDLLTRYSFLRPSDVEIIPQGYGADLAGADVPENAGGPFMVVHTGTFYGDWRSPRVFLEAVQLAIRLGLRIEFIHAGPSHVTGVAQHAAELGLGAAVRDLGHLPYREAVALQRRANVLLVVGNRVRDQLPGKVVEYVGAGKPILCLSQGPDDLAARFVHDHGLGVVVPNRTPDVLAVIRRLYGLWEAGRLETLYTPTNVEPFTWHRLGRRLEHVFREAMTRHGGAPLAAGWPGIGPESRLGS